LGKRGSKTGFFKGGCLWSAFFTFSEKKRVFLKNGKKITKSESRGPPLSPTQLAISKKGSKKGKIIF